MNPLQTTTTILGGLAIFLFGMKIMSEGLQKVAGTKMRRILSVMTGHRLSGVGTGLLVTCAVQSSSATTVMLVGFVHAGLINLTQSIGVVMGANIGTTFTGWLVALLGFKIKIADMALPAIMLGFFPRMFGARRLADWGEVLLGFGILFLGLDFMKDSVGQLKDSATFLSWISGTRADVLGWRIVAVGVGALVTLIIQSSSATMAITMTLAAQGMIDLPTACALVLGENIGTTITANLASIGTSSTARRTARAHFVFNLIGAIWAIILFNPFLSLIKELVQINGGGTASQAAIAATLAAFHTTFNVVNTGLFFPFTRQLAWLASRLVPEEKEPKRTGLLFLDPKVLSSPPMALHAARSEVGRMLREVSTMLDKVLALIAAPGKKMGAVADAITESEQTVDYLEKEITEYLVSTARAETSQEQSAEIAGLINTVGDIERIGDHCESLCLLLAKRHALKIAMSDQAIQELIEMGEPVTSFVELLRSNLFTQRPDLLSRAGEFEEKIDSLRTRLRERHIGRLQESVCEVTSGLIFIDMLTSFEKIGDHAYNIAEVLAGKA